MKIYFDTFDAFIEMGGHGFYIWLCYAIVSVSLIGYYFISAKSSSKATAELKRFYARIEAQSQRTKQSEKG